MSETLPSQTIFERYLHEEMTLQEAAEALERLLRRHKAVGGDRSSLRIQKPRDGLPSRAEHERAEALFAEMNRRAAAG